MTDTKTTEAPARIVVMMPEIYAIENAREQYLGLDNSYEVSLAAAIRDVLGDRIEVRR